MKKFYAFYVYPYGACLKKEEFLDEDDVLELVRKAADSSNGYSELSVVYGELLEFEPHEKVTAWRIKES